MSLAVFTDSTTATASPALTFRPTAGTSTNTTSVSSCCAWSVIPTVATSPLTRTHSCELAYLRSDGTFELIKSWYSENWFLHHGGGKSFPAHFNFEGTARPRKVGRN